MTKKATIRDVAREAGVSVATVSYVLNNRPNQKISDDTKKKVLQIANLLQYSPSFAAKQLTTGKSNIIGIQIGRYALRNTDHYDLINVLIELLLQKGYSTIFLPPIKGDMLEPQPNIDGIICLDLSQREFELLSNNYLVPIVCSDMIVNHYLFFQIYSDFSALPEKLADFPNYTVLSARPHNENYADFLAESLKGHICFCDNAQMLFGHIRQTPPPYVTLGEYLSLCALLSVPKKNVLPVLSAASYDFPVTPFYRIDLAPKASKLIDAMFDAMARNPVDHDVRLLF